MKRLLTVLIVFSLLLGKAFAADEHSLGEDFRIGTVERYHPVLRTLTISGNHYTIDKNARVGDVVKWPGKVYAEGSLDLGPGSEVYYWVNPENAKKLKAVFRVIK